MAFEYAIAIDQTKCNYSIEGGGGRREGGGGGGRGGGRGGEGI